MFMQSPKPNITNLNFSSLKFESFPINKINFFQWNSIFFKELKSSWNWSLKFNSLLKSGFFNLNSFKILAPLNIT
jgi:hypothetical protein